MSLREELANNLVLFRRSAGRDDLIIPGDEVYHCSDQMSYGIVVSRDELLTPPFGPSKAWVLWSRDYDQPSALRKNIIDNMRNQIMAEEDSQIMKILMDNER